LACCSCATTHAQAREVDVGAHARQQLARRERLDQVVVRARRQPLDDASSPARADSKITGTVHVRGSARRARSKAKPSSFRHHHVAQDQVGRLRPGGRQRRRAVGHGGHVVAGGQQRDT